jgi:hypothetical protein
MAIVQAWMEGRLAGAPDGKLASRKTGEVYLVLSLAALPSCATHEGVGKGREGGKGVAAGGGEVGVTVADGWMLCVLYVLCIHGRAVMW